MTLVDRWNRRCKYCNKLCILPWPINDFDIEGTKYVGEFSIKTWVMMHRRCKNRALKKALARLNESSS